MDNMTEKDVSISILKANIYTLAFALPLLGALAILFIALHGWLVALTGAAQFLKLENLILVILIGMPVHELLHAIGWLYFGGKKISDVKIGFQWKMLTPYAHLKVPVEATAYRLGTLLPGLVLGFLPYIAGTLTGNGWLAAFGLLYIFAAGGDLLMVWILRDVEGASLVKDHPARVGCLVLLPK